MILSHTGFFSHSALRDFKRVVEMEPHNRDALKEVSYNARRALNIHIVLPLVSTLLPLVSTLLPLVSLML